MILPCIDIDGNYRQFKFKLGNKYHNGRDRKCNEGTPVYSTKNGKVIFSDNIKGFGSFGKPGGVVMIQSDDNNHTILYGHIKPLVNLNERVTKGQLIGRIIKYEYMYNNKKIRADHLHWCSWKKGGIPTTKLGYVSKKELKYWEDPNINLGD